MLRKYFLQFAQPLNINYGRYNVKYCGYSYRFYCKSQSKYPDATDPSKVGSYGILAKCGMGEVYTDVLEYRVWFPDDRNWWTGMEPFATYR